MSEVPLYSKWVLTAEAGLSIPRRASTQKATGGTLEPGLDPFLRFVPGYLAHKKQPPPKDPTKGLSVGPYGGPRRGRLFLVSEVPLYWEMVTLLRISGGIGPPQRSSGCRV